MSNEGRDALWLWFGLDHAGWLTMPRVMMHDMPDEWQAKMAALLNEWDATWPNMPDLTTQVTCKKGRKFTKTPEALQNYRHPDGEYLDAMKRK